MPTGVCVCDLKTRDSAQIIKPRLVFAVYKRLPHNHQRTHRPLSHVLVKNPMVQHWLSLSLVVKLSQFSSVHSLTISYPKIHFSIILPSASWSLKWQAHSKFPHKHIVFLSSEFHICPFLDDNNSVL